MKYRDLYGSFAVGRTLAARLRFHVGPRIQYHRGREGLRSSRGYEVDCSDSGQDVISRIVSAICLSVILLDLPVTKLCSDPATAKLEELYAIQRFLVSNLRANSSGVNGFRSNIE